MRFSLDLMWSDDTMPLPSQRNYGYTKNSVPGTVGEARETRDVPSPDPLVRIEKILTDLQRRIATIEEVLKIRG